MSQKLLIDFEDTLSTIELPLGDNVVLFKRFEYKKF